MPTRQQWLFFVDRQSQDQRFACGFKFATGSSCFSKVQVQHISGQLNVCFYCLSSWSVAALPGVFFTPSCFSAM